MKAISPRIFILLSIFICFISVRVHAYQAADTFFRAGVDEYMQEHYTSAICLLRQSQSSKLDNRTIPLSTFYLARSYFEIGSLDSAKYFARLTLREHYPKQIVDLLELDHPPAFKHYASDILCNYYITNHRYHSARHYLHLCTKTYPLNSFCNVDVIDNMLYTASQYAYIYKKLGKTHKAERALFSVMFVKPWAFKGDIADSLRLLLLTDRHNAKIKKSLALAVTHLHIKKIITASKDTLIFYYINFMGDKISMPYSAQDGSWELSINSKEPTKEDIIAYIKQTAMYQVVENL